MNVTEPRTSAGESASPAMLSADVRTHAEDLSLITGLLVLAVLVAVAALVQAAGYMPVLVALAAVAVAAFTLGRRSRVHGGVR